MKSIDTIASIDEIQDLLHEHLYIADRGLATAIFLALKLAKPLFLEGEAGVGKTEVAKVLASMLERPLIRLQCYEGLDVNTAVYEWNYTRQMLQIRLLEATGHVNEPAAIKEIFSPEFLLKRPLLQAIDRSDGIVPVLLVDELDRADEEFEAFLLEILSDFQITVPEIGTIKAAQPPVVVITSNRTREIHDALKRRCLYHWIDYPSFEKEYSIVLAKVPQAPDRLARQVVAFVQDALLAREMRRLQLSCLRLIWLNPLLGSANYEPLTRGIQAALPYVDDFLPVHNLESLRQLGDLLERLSERRPLRRQYPVCLEPVA